MSRLLAMAGPRAHRRHIADGMRDLAGATGRAAEVGSGMGWLTCDGDGGGVAVHGGLALAMDGRIFNRDEVGAEGTDAQALLRLAAVWGLAAAMEKLNADAAVILWDPRRNTLEMARDRWGMRPLYWTAAAGVVGVSSRPRPLLGLPGVRVEADPSYVARIAGSHYRTFDNDPEASPYTDVRQVPAASVVSLSLGEDGTIRRRRTERYWTLTAQDDLDLTETELAERYRDLLVDAVRRRLAVAPRPAFTLSGGMDSGSVLASAVHATGDRQRAYSTVYADPTYDERNEIATMLDRCVESWHPVEIAVPDVMGTVSRLVTIHDEPVATATWLSHALLADAVAAEGVGSILGGLGGDELNAGEFEYFPCHFADLLAEGDTATYEAEVAGWARYHDHPVFRKDADVARAMVARIADPAHRGHVLPDLGRLGRYVHTVDPSLFDLAAYRPVMEHPFGTLLKNRTWQDLTRETMPCCLRAEDRNLSPLGIERFHPFLDHRLAELMFRVPGRMKIRDGVTKRLLREAMRGILPEETRTRIAKTGWNAPAHIWFSGDNRDPLMDLIASRAFRDRGVYIPEEVDRIADEHEQIVLTGQPRENHMMFLWQLVNLELWLREVDGLRARLAGGMAVA
ncbi:MAG: asparagine synthase-related protein [Thermoleophilia bacterium]